MRMWTCFLHPKPDLLKLRSSEKKSNNCIFQAKTDEKDTKVCENVGTFGGNYERSSYRLTDGSTFSHVPVIQKANWTHILPKDLCQLMTSSNPISCSTAVSINKVEWLWWPWLLQRSLRHQILLPWRWKQVTSIQVQKLIFWNLTAAGIDYVNTSQDSRIRCAFLTCCLLKW